LRIERKKSTFLKPKKLTAQNLKAPEILAIA
jgi:hypothetical protein